MTLDGSDRLCEIAAHYHELVSTDWDGQDDCGMAGENNSLACSVITVRLDRVASKATQMTICADYLTFSHIKIDSLFFG